MNKHYHELLDETYYEEELNNGLKVVIFHKKDFHSTSAAFGTPYGAFDIKVKQLFLELQLTHMCELKCYFEIRLWHPVPVATYTIEINLFISYRINKLVVTYAYEQNR